ncbi:MAG: type III-B CRISPR module RAMP protein Cmr1, partial [Thermogemmatispora sp.]|uniref:type III-B CRISPR module RAMP protein Cmr1 n=1 Tax=Thermogemmatispora sp. TaxID=1968838 RepID=UPI0026327F59
YRALIGGIVGGNLAEVRRRETEVFGSAEYGSPISIRISEVPPPEQGLSAFKLADKEPGRNYLFWSMNKTKDRSSRQYYPPGTHFKLILTAHEKNRQALKEAIIALWLLTNFGGLGARSRRCAGSLTICSSTLPSALEFNLPGLSPGDARSQSLDELANTLTLGLQEIQRFYKIEKPSEPQNRSFDILSPATCSIWVLSQSNPWEKVEEALEFVGRTYKEYRQSLSDKQRKALGLPFRESKERLASPLHLHITATKAGYICVATLFSKNALLSDQLDINSKFIVRFQSKRELKL